MLSDKFISIIYVIAWIVTYLVYQKKKKIFDAGSFILLSYLFYSIISCILIDNHFYRFNKLHLFPYVYLFIALYIGLVPILKFQADGSIPIRRPSMFYIHLICFICIVSSLIDIPSAIINFTSGMRSLLIDSAAGADLYASSQVNAGDAGHGVSNLSAIISGALSGIKYLMLIYYLTLENKRSWIVLGLVLSCFMGIISGVSVGQRGAIIEPLLIIISTFFFLKKYLNKRCKIIFRYLGIFVIILLSIPLILITISRFDNNKTTPVDSVLFYTGQANLYFNNFALDDNGIRYGDRIVPLFKKLLLFQNVPNNFIERRNKYPNLYVNDEVFITYVGDFAIDFGPVVAFILLVSLSFSITRNTKNHNNEYYFHQIVLLHMVLYICTMGGLKLFSFSDIAGNLKLIVYLLTYFCFKNIFISPKSKYGK